MQIPPQITKNNSQGIIFAIISCQRVGGPGDCKSTDLNEHGWARTRDDLTKMRHRLDATTKTLYELPTGMIIRPNTPFRKAYGTTCMHMLCV